MLDFIQKQVERGKQQGTVTETATYSEFKRESSQERVTLNLNLKRKAEGAFFVNIHNVVRDFFIKVTNTI
jgi:hypothetical protein